MGKRALSTKVSYRNVRKYLYGVMVASSPVVVYYGLVTAEEAGLWLAFGGIALGATNSIALANLPAKEKETAEDAGI